MSTDPHIMQDEPQNGRHRDRFMAVDESDSYIA